MHNKALNELLQKVNVVKMHCSSRTVIMVVEDKKTKEESFLLIEDIDSRINNICLGTELVKYEELIDREARELCFMSEKTGIDCKVNIKEFDEGEIFCGFATSALSSLSWLNHIGDRQIGIDVNNRIDKIMKPELKELIELKQDLKALQLSLQEEQNYEHSALVRRALLKIKANSPTT